MTTTLRILRAAIAATLMALAANSFLKYLWWTACYSAWYGIPKLAPQWRAAGAHATFNGWVVIILETAAVLIVCTLVRLRASQLSAILKIGVRVAISLAFTLAGTGAFVLALSWLKQRV